MGWEDAPIVQAAPKRAAWEDAPVVYPAAQPKAASGLLEAVQAGLQGSAPGLFFRSKLPDVQLSPTDSKWYERAAAGASQIAAEFPLMVAGGIGGGAAGTAVGGPVGTLIGGGAGAFAVPAAIRESYIQAYSKGEITSTADFLNRAAIVLKHTGKEAAIGAATAGAGKLAGVGAQAAGLGAKATTATVLTAEAGTLTVAPAVLEGRMPEPQDFVDAAVLLVGLKGATAGARKLAEVYAKTGKTPIEVVADSKADPTIVDDLRAGTPAEAKPTAASAKPSQPSVYREGNSDSIADLLDGAPRTSGIGLNTFYVATHPELALGQGRNKGILVELNPEGFDTKRDMSKPAAQFLAEQGKYELTAVAKQGENSFDYIRSITLKDGWQEQGSRGFNMRVENKLNTLVKNGEWTVETTPEGKVYRPVEKAAAEPAPANEIPRAYENLARDENARNAVPDPSSEAAQLLNRPFALVPQLPGEPVLLTHVNYNYLNTTQEVMGAMSRLSELYEGKVKEATRGEVPWEQTYAEARQLFEAATGEKAPEAPLVNADYAKLSADIYARKQLLISGAEQLMSMRQAYADAKAQGLATDQMKLELLAQIDRVAQAQAAVRGSQAEVGRALNILKSTNRDKAYYDQLTNLIDGRFGVEGKKLGDANFDTMVELMGRLGSPAEALKFAARASKATTWEKIVEAWKAGLVSGPFTQIANILGNSTFMVTRPLVDAVAATLGGIRRSPDAMSAAEPLARVIGNIHGTIDGAKAAWAVLKTGEALGGKSEAHRKAIEGLTGEIVRTPFRLLSSADAFFRVANERGEAYALATREAVKEGYNPATREFRDRVAELATNPTDKMIEQISTAGERFTFNAPLGEKGRAIQSTIKALHLEWAIPFVQTPANVAKEMLRLTPAAPIVKEWRDAIKKGGPEADKAVAEMVIGTALATTVFSFALSGNISGQGDPDPNKRRTQMASGWQPYSIKIGDKWHSYQRLQPIGTLIGMAADAATVWDNANEDESDKIPKILATAFANAITNQTFLQGVTNIVNAISDPERFGPRFVQNFAASVIPGLVGQTAAMMDPYQREIYSVLDAMQNRIPGAREGLMPKRDVYGEPIAAKERLGGISPVTTSEMSTDKVRLEAARLGVGVMPAPKNIELPAGRDPKLGKVELTPEQRDVFADKAGHLAYRILTQLVASPTWDTMPDMAQRNAMNRVFEVSRLAGKAAAVPPEQIRRETERIANELKIRLQAK